MLGAYPCSKVRDSASMKKAPGHVLNNFRSICYIP